jgi:hypothetical protein
VEAQWLEYGMVIGKVYRKSGLDFSNNSYPSETILHR